MQWCCVTAGSTSGKPRIRCPDKVICCCETLSTAICASDVHFMDHPRLGIDDPTGRSLYDADRDIVMGHEFVGEVVGHGPGCSEAFPIGARVTSMPIRLVDGGADGVRIIGQHPEAQGSFGELLVVPEARPGSSTATYPATPSPSSMLRGRRVLCALRRMQPGEMPIVIGAGAIGLSAVAALASRGIEPIIVSDYNAERRELARDGFGAHVLVDPAEQSLFDVLREVRAEHKHGGSPWSSSNASAPPGPIQQIVRGGLHRTRIYCAGGWYTGDTLSITEATRKG